ncbi:hypothetical protein GDO86_012854 [Hymenochirus boettgeri]|uniref:NXPE C-terminal domain-containing protein n=1 Tax=Hymenochirus boettgeri TaxID=247094 RepID=A0A8T2IW50_9PIPI|nr:hypothetical protein GDO86_012854 [Hymenochirus boettgeri]
MDIFSAINRSIPNNFFKNINSTSSAMNSRAILLDKKPTHCVGDSITVQVEMFDYYGNRKIYGGDFLRARIFSPELKAGASGRIEDLNNGKYNVHFTLFWEGTVTISILLMHPSEGVAALWRARNLGYKNIIYTGKFHNRTKEVHTECGFYLDSSEEKCEYGDKDNGESFYCIKPHNVPCEAIISMKSGNREQAHLTNLEKSLFIRSNIGVQIPQNFERIQASNCQGISGEIKAKCSTGMTPPFPGGYFLNDVWHSVFCNLSTVEPLSQIHNCLTGRVVYLMGDSTIRQWIEYLPSIMKSLRNFNLHRSGLESMLLAIDPQNNIVLQWKKHSHPIVASHSYLVKDDAYISNQIDQLAGGPQTVIAISLGQHFRPFPIHLFIKRVINIHRAIENILLRSPETKVIIKTENIREFNLDAERFSDFHGYINYLIVKELFQDLPVAVVDAWDMTVAFNSNNVHPAENVIRSQINMFLSYIC